MSESGTRCTTPYALTLVPEKIPSTEGQATSAVHTCHHAHTDLETKAVLWEIKLSGTGVTVIPRLQGKQFTPAPGCLRFWSAQTLPSLHLITRATM